MSDSKKNAVAGIFILILLGFLGFYIYKSLTGVGSSSQLVGNGTATTTGETGNSPTVSLQTTGKGDTYKVEVLPSVPAGNSENGSIAGLKLPNLDQPIVAKYQLDPSVLKVMESNIATAEAGLKKDPNNRLLWLSLGIYWKTLGDFDMAVNILDFVTKGWPNDPVAYNNLGDLYQSYIKNYSLAEKNYLKVVDLEPNFPQTYENLYQLYSYQYPGQQSKALPILLMGLQNNPKSIDIMIYIARHYRDAKDAANAQKYYEMALALAKEEANNTAVQSITSEMNQ